MQPPAKDQGILLVAAHGDVSVADIDGEDHGSGLLSQRSIMYIIYNSAPAADTQGFCWGRSGEGVSPPRKEIGKKMSKSVDKIAGVWYYT